MRSAIRLARSLFGDGTPLATDIWSALEQPAWETEAILTYRTAYNKCRAAIIKSATKG